MVYLIISVVVLNLVAIFIPKRLSKIEIYATSVFATLFALIVDVYLDLKLDMYGYFKEGPQWKSIVATFGLYPAANIIILNYFPFKKRIKIKVLYILGWAILLVLYEWGSIKSGFFYHKEWKLSYSALAYPFILVILVCNLKWIRKLISQAK